MADFEEYRVFQNPRIFHTDFLHQQLVTPFPWPPPHVVGRPLEFLEAGTGHVASWSEADNQGGLSPRRKEKMTVDGMFSFSFFTIAVQQRRCDLPLDNVPDPSGIVSPCTEIPLLPVFFELLPPTFSTL